MRFTINREEFLKGLSIAARAVNPKSTFPVLSNLKIDLDDKGLFITGSNGDLTIKTLVPYYINDKEIIRNYTTGTVLVNLKVIDWCREIRSEEISFEVIDDTIVNITDSTNGSEITLQCIKSQEYPDLDLEPDGTEISLTHSEFSKIVNQTAFAASTKEQRLLLTALNFEATNGVLTVTATDSYRLAKKESKIPDGINFVANIPAKMVTEVDHLIENQEYISIAVNDVKALFSFDRIVVSTRLVAGDYPNTKNIIPHTINHKLNVKTDEILTAIKLANLITERENVVDLTMNEEEVQVSAKSSQVGSSTNKINTFKYEGAPLKISFNSEFVSSAIRALDSEDVIFEFVGEMKQFVIKNPSDESVIQIMTPIRTYY